METRNRKVTENPLETALKTDPGCYASIEELIEEFFEDRTKSKRFSWRSIVPSSDALWELIAAVAFASGGLLTTGHPLVAVMAAGAVPFAMHALRLLAAAAVGSGLKTVVQRILH